MCRFSNVCRLGSIAFVVASLAFASTASAAGPRASSEPPHDARLGPKKDLNGYFPFVPSNTPEEWGTRAERVRRQVLVATGLWPMPAKTPVNAVVHGKIERDGVTIEKVFLESYPGHFVTGNLFRPMGRQGPFPGVLCPHGHWPNGRFYDAGEAEIQKQIQTGAERYEISGRYPLQARAIQLARMGCVVFHYDMIGYADSVQLQHRPGVRAHMNTPENWGFFSPQAELRLQSMMGLQTYNSVRALDWLSELPDVDPSRIAVTGASGGGTQTMILCAIEPRVSVGFPAVMVSTSMQGGCSCENCNYLRVGSGNIEFAALFAPKPYGMTSADDWTKELETKGLPELKQHFAMLGAPNNVTAALLTQFPHNYNYQSRAAMYGWFNKHLGLGLNDPIVEEDFTPLTISELSVWDDAHPKPLAGDEYERSLLRTITEDSQSQIAALTPTDSESLGKYREVIGGALDVMIGRGLPAAGSIEHEKGSENDRGDYIEFVGLLRNPSQGEALPVVFLHPKNWNQQAVLWIHEDGKSGLYAEDGSLKPAIQALMKAGTSVAGIDLFQQGEFLSDGRPARKNALVQTYSGAWAEYSAYTYGYNHPLFAQRVHDILSLVSFARHHHDKPVQVHLVGMDSAGPLVAAAAALAGDTIDKLAIDTGSFRFANLTEIDDANFLPGAAKYGDLPGILILAARPQTWLSRETPQTIPGIAATGANVTYHTGSESSEETDAAAWLLQ